MNTNIARRAFNTFLFNKGKLTLDKLRDKCHVDGVIDHVSIAFPDQYGRLWSTNVNAEHFINQAESEKSFKFSYNPFNKDLLGKDIEMPDDFKFDKSVQLKPDLLTLRQSVLSQSGAFVLADPIDIPVAPRIVLKQKVQDLSTQLDPQISLALTMGLQKFKPDEAQPVPVDSGILTQGWQQNHQVALDMESQLRQSGIPITTFESLGGEHNQFKLTLYSKQNQTAQDLITYADSFVLAKWLVKHEATASGFTSNFLPSEAGSIDLNISLKPSNVLKQLYVFLPTLNSVRKVCSKADTHCTLENMLQADVNLYQLFTKLLNDYTATSEQELLPSTFRDAVHLLEQIVDENEDPYWCALVAHELKQIYEQQSYEAERVY